MLGSNGIIVYNGHVETGEGLSTPFTFKKKKLIMLENTKIMVKLLLYPSFLNKLDLRIIMDRFGSDTLLSIPIIIFQKNSHIQIHICLNTLASEFVSYEYVSTHTCICYLYF